MSPADDVEHVFSVRSVEIRSVPRPASHYTLIRLRYLLPARRSTHSGIEQINTPPTLQCFTMLPQITTNGPVLMQCPSSVKICGRPYILGATCQMLNEASSDVHASEITPPVSNHCNAMLLGAGESRADLQHNVSKTRLD